MILSPEFEQKFNSWLQGAQKIINDDWVKNHFTSSPPILTPDKGNRFIRIWREDSQKSAHAFIDVEGGLHKGVMNKPGDVLKPATWRAPAKHARGNIFDEYNGLHFMKWTGPDYLK